jgi:hypothetical protein
MSAHSILCQLHSQGFSVTLEGDLLAVRPSERLTPELRQAIQTYKPDLIELLVETDSHHQGSTYPDGRGMVKCYYCRRLVDRVLCQLTGKRMYGIALLKDCKAFAMRSALSATGRRPPPLRQTEPRSGEGVRGSGPPRL